MAPPLQIKIVRSHRRSIALEISRDGIVIVRAPHLLPKFLINQFVEKNSGWIEKRIGRLSLHKKSLRSYIDGEEFMFLGQKYKLKIGHFTKIEIKDNFLLFPKALEFRIQKELENWFIAKAKEVIRFHAEQIGKEMKTSYVSISFSDTKSKWGSCTHDNRLQFNWRLIMAPLLVLRYVVVHELAHTLEKNHSHKFWSRVAVFNPSYKQQIKWLKEHGDSLHL